MNMLFLPPINEQNIEFPLRLDVDMKSFVFLVMFFILKKF